jgi:hypothetical protein
MRNASSIEVRTFFHCDGESFELGDASAVLRSDPSRCHGNATFCIVVWQAAERAMWPDVVLSSSLHSISA